MYEEVLKDLDICSKAESCMGCSRENDKAGIPDCYRAVMVAAADALRERLAAEKSMIDRDELVKELGIQIRKTMTDSKGYIDGMVAASNIAVLMPAAGKEQG
jgi:hypothetical protein